MWKLRKEDEKPSIPAAPPKQEAAPAVKVEEPRPTEAQTMDQFRADVAHIGKSVVIKGELSGGEDLVLDGEVEGNIELRGHSLTIGPNGRVRANIQARDVVVHGKVDGNLRADRVELKKSAVLNGDVFTHRIVIEDGAFLKGGIDIQKAEPKPDVRQEAARQAAGAGSSSAPVTVAQQSSLLDNK